MTIRPLLNRIVIQPDKKEEMTAGGLYLPESLKGDEPQRGTVVALGEGVIEDGETKPILVKLGDKVIFGRYTGANISVGSTNFIIMYDTDVLAVLND